MPEMEIATAGAGHLAAKVARREPRRCSRRAPSSRTRTSSCYLPRDALPMNLKSRLAEALASAAKVNRSLMTLPAAVLWPDADCQWQKVVPFLSDAVPPWRLARMDSGLARVTKDESSNFFPHFFV